MRSMARKRQKGFTLVELIISVCIVAILGSIALAQLRDYTRRAKLSEVMMAVSRCKNTVTENFLTLDTAPQPGRWGCEGGGGSYYAGNIETSSDGVIRVPIANLDRLMNGQYIYLVPARADGATPMAAPGDLGKGISSWICGSDWSPVRNALPVNCRIDTTTFASQDFL
ncbi:MAG: tfp pilus assembly protein major pilin PilA [Ramlibacter sp.]|nr:tfp pilus assembly protein major pilin PilA [Ramlibacter sp.]